MTQTEELMLLEPGRIRGRLGEIYVAERRRLLRLVRSRLFDASEEDAEDLVSEAFDQLLQRADFISQIENVTAYLYRVVTNRITDRRRAPRREVSFDAPADAGDDAPLRRALEPVSNDLTPEQALERKQLRKRLRDALLQLGERERAVWIATELEGRTFAELAAETGEPIGTLLSRKSRAGARLRSLLSAERSQ